VIGDRAYLRAWKFLTPHKPIQQALENISNTVDGDRDFSLSEDDEDGDGCDGCKKEIDVS
jgi:hypothetical protein